LELHELETVVVDELIHGDVMDEVRGDPNPSCCGGDEEDLGDALDEALEVGG